MVISSENLYASRNVKCVSKIEHAYYSWKSVGDLICVHCGSIDIDKVSHKEKTKEYTTIYPHVQFAKKMTKKKYVLVQRRSRYYLKGTLQGLLILKSSILRSKKQIIKKVKPALIFAL